MHLSSQAHVVAFMSQIEKQRKDSADLDADFEDELFGLETGESTLTTSAPHAIAEERGGPWFGGLFDSVED